MKYSTLFSIILALISCHSTENIERDKSEIIDLIESEQKYFMARDEEKWKSCYVNALYTFSHWTLIYEPGDVVATSGYEDLVKTVTDYWNTSESKGIQPFKNKDYNIQIRDHVAWARFMQRNTGYGHVVDSYETRNLKE